MGEPACWENPHTLARYQCIASWAFCWPFRLGTELLRLLRVLSFADTTHAAFGEVLGSLRAIAKECCGGVLSWECAGGAFWRALEPRSTCCSQPGNIVRCMGSLVDATGGVEVDFLRTSGFTALLVWQVTDMVMLLGRVCGTQCVLHLARWNPHWQCFQKDAPECKATLCRPSDHSRLHINLSLVRISQALLGRGFADTRCDPQFLHPSTGQS